MRNRFGGTIVSIVVATALTGVAMTVIFRIAEQPLTGQVRAYVAPRTPDGKPDLNGIWQTLNTANWDLQDHAPQPSPIAAMGARGAIPAGLGVVEGGEIPYRPEAASKKSENLKNWLARDPTVKCYLPGVPRATDQLPKCSNRSAPIQPPMIDATPFAV